MPSYTLHTPAGSFRAFPALIAAEYNGIDVSVAEFDAEKVAKMSPSGKAPVLDLPNGQQLFSSHAIARYIAGIRRDVGLTGGGSLVDAAMIDAWMDFAGSELELPACVWFYPVAGYMPYNEDAHAKAKVDLAKGLTVLNDYLEGKTHLVGDSITLADIIVASTLLYPFKLVCDEAYLKPFGNVTQWFNTCVTQPEFNAIVGKVNLCKKETPPAKAATDENN